MGYEPTVIAATDYPIARRPSFGAEMLVSLSSEETYELGQVYMEAVASGTWEADVPNAAVLLADPSDIVVMVSPEVKSAAQVVVTVTGTNSADGALTGTATIKPPAWVPNQTFDFGEGYAVDVVAASAFKTITGVTFTQGSKGGKLRLFKLPALDTFSLVGVTTAKDFTPKTRTPKPIADGLDGSAFVKFGRTAPGTLSITQKFVSFSDGLMRFAGRRCTAVAVVEKEETLITERLIFGNFVPPAKIAFPDGDDEATNSAEGMFEAFFVFSAK